MDAVGVALVVNAGGQSRRMGSEKALLPVPPANNPLIVYIIERLAGCTSDAVVVVTNQPEVAQVVSKRSDVRVVADRWPKGGALGGVATGLALCRGWAMVVACDMPLVDVALFTKLIALVEANPTRDAIVPRTADQAQPFHALWHRRALPVLERCLDENHLGVQAALAQLDVLWVEPPALGLSEGSLAFSNINTPEDWQHFLAMLANQNGPVA
jgi:molybdopterin-guanine dinucleotide biosynthesis protein A